MYIERKFNKENTAEMIHVYDDNGTFLGCYNIYKDLKGHEFYRPNNPHEKWGLFNDRIKDAVECITEDYGDVISVTDLVGSNIVDVVRYIDREYGESIRQKFIEGWKDTNFAYAIKLQFKNTLYGGYVLSKDNTLLGYGYDKANILGFDTEYDAINFINAIELQLTDFISEYLANKNAEEYMKILNRIKSTYTSNSVYWEAFNSINLDTGERNYTLKPIQLVV